MPEAPDWKKALLRAAHNFKEGDVDAGLRRLAKLGEQLDSPENADAADGKLELAWAWREAGHREEALELLERYVGRFADDPQGHCDLGDLLYELDRGEDAEEALTIALQLDPSSAKARLLRGNVRLFALEDPSGAVDDLSYLNAHGLSRTNLARRNVAHLLGEALAEMDNPVEAIVQFELALDLSDDPEIDAELHCRLAECCDLQGDQSGMRRHLGAFLELAPNIDASKESVRWAMSELEGLAELGD